MPNCSASEQSKKIRTKVNEIISHIPTKKRLLSIIGKNINYISLEELERELFSLSPDIRNSMMPYLDDLKNSYIQINEPRNPGATGLIESKRIFLSHSSHDKPLVRRIYNSLEKAGFHPWMDEEMMPAGTHLDDAILAGIQTSIAVVFFVSPNFINSQFIRIEIEYSISEERSRLGEFKIIPLLINGATFSNSPNLLKRFVFKEGLNDLLIINHIFNSLAPS